MAEWLEREVASVKECGIEEVQVAKCPFCGRYHTTPYMYYFVEYQYCPNCGKRIAKSEIHCMHSQEEVAKSFIEDVSAVEDQLDGSDVEETEDCEEK